MAAIWIPKRLVEISLINTAGINKKNFVRHCEFEYESRIYALAKEIVDEDKHIIMLTGPSASGKTTSCNKIAEKLRSLGKKAQVVSMDNFFKNPEGYPKLPDGSKDYENVGAVDVGLLDRCLTKLIKDGKATFPEFDFRTETRIEDAIELEIGDGYVIVEGIHALNPIVTESLPKDSFLTIYAGLREEYSNRGQRVLPTRDIRLVRRMIRDYKHRGHSPEKTIAMWGKVCEGEDKYIKVFKQNADFLLDTSFSYEILVMNSALEKFVSEVGDACVEQLKLDEIRKLFNICGFMPEGYIPTGSMLREFFG